MSNAKYKKDAKGTLDSENFSHARKHRIQLPDLRSMMGD